VTYWPLGEVMKEHFALSDGDRPAAVLASLRPRDILGLTLGLDVAHGLHPLAARDRFQDAWVEFCEEISADRTLVMLIEDIHWAEDLLLDLLERLVAYTRGRCCSWRRRARVAREATWMGRGARPRTTVVLDALSVEDSVRMLDLLLGGTLPSGLRDVVIPTGRGQPFLRRGGPRDVIDLGLLRQEGEYGRWPTPA
jgi:hypothetical protein